MLQPFHVAIAKEDNSIEIVDEKWNIIYELEGHTRQINSIIQLMDGRLASCSSDVTIRIWDKSNLSSCTILVGDGQIYSIIQLTDERLVSLSYKSMSIWDLQTRQSTVLKIKDTMPKRMLVYDIKQLFDGRLAIALSDGTIRIFTLKGDLPEIKLIGHSSFVVINSLIQLHDGRLASAADGGELRIWNITNQSCICLDATTCPTHEDDDGMREIQALIQLWNGRLISGGFGGMYVWNDDEITEDSRGLEREFLPMNKFLELPSNHLLFGFKNEIYLGDFKTERFNKIGQTYEYFANTKVANGTNMCLVFTKEDKRKFQQNMFHLLNPYLIRELHPIVCNFINNIHFGT